LCDSSLRVFGNPGYMGEIEQAEKSATTEMTFLEKINYELKNRTKQEQETAYQLIKQPLWLRDAKNA
jgi:hypothetical protein